MKKFIFAMVAMATVCLVSCGSKGDSKAGGEGETVEYKGFDYKNDKCSYTVTLPEGFSAQNDLPEFEEMGATKLFLGDGAQISIQLKELPTGEYAPTPKERLQSEANFFKEDADMANLKKDVTEDKVRVTYAREDGALEGQIIKVANGKIAMLFFRYPAGKDAELKDAMDMVDATFKF